jgi:hypothetical protein
MLNLDDRPALPAIPRFRRDMEQSLIAAARAEKPAPAGPAPQRRRYLVGGVAAAAVVAAGAVGIGYAVTGSHSPSATPGGNLSGSPNASGVHIHLAAFSVDSQPGGTVTLTLTQQQILDPTALRRALAQAGVPALVTVGSVCTTPGPASVQPFSAPEHQADGSSITTITPSEIPVGDELSVGYFTVPGGAGVHISLVQDRLPLTCSSAPPAPPIGSNR